MAHLVAYVLQKFGPFFRVQILEHATVSAGRVDLCRAGAVEFGLAQWDHTVHPTDKVYIGFPIYFLVLRENYDLMSSNFDASISRSSWWQSSPKFDRISSLKYSQNNLLNSIIDSGLYLPSKLKVLFLVLDPVQDCCWNCTFLTNEISLRVNSWKVDSRLRSACFCAKLASFRVFLQTDTKSSCLLRVKSSNSLAFLFPIRLNKSYVSIAIWISLQLSCSLSKLESVFATFSSNNSIRISNPANSNLFS